MPNDPAGVLLLIDACTIINVFASRREREILAAQDQPVGVVDVVRREAGFVLKGGEGDDADERQPIDLDPVAAAGLLQIVVPTPDELDDFVDLTLQFKGDGEAMTIAVALARGWTVVTDDRKAIRLIAGRTPVRSSLDLVRTWSIAAAIPPAALRAVLHDIRVRGNYAPGPNHPLRDWWDMAIGD